MSRADDVFEVFVAANPVPDVAVLEADRVPAERFLSDVARGGRTMRDVTELKPESDRSRTGSAAPAIRPPWWRRDPLVAAAAFVVVLLIGAAWLVALIGPDEVEPAEPPDPAAELEREAVDAVERFYAAVNSGDIDTVMALSHPTAAELSDERMWGFNAAMAANGHALEVGDCTATATGPTLAAVRCTAPATDPVLQALGITEITAPFSYLDGGLAWQPFQGADVGELGRAYAEYLQSFHPAEYDAVCSQAAYAPGSIVHNNGLALTAECGELAAPIAGDIAQWVRDGRPDVGATGGSAAVLEQEAVDVVEQFYAAVNAGDIDTVMALSHSTVADLSDERMWGFNAVLAESGYPLEVRDCEASPQGEASASVRCTYPVTDPVFLALGIRELTAPFTYLDGQVVWLPWTGADTGGVGRAYADYLQQFHLDEYDAACSPGPYSPGSFVYNGGIALTPQCADVLAPKLEDIAQWIRDGRP